MNTTAETFIKEDEENEDILYQKDASISAELDTGDGIATRKSETVEGGRFSDGKNIFVTTLSPNLEQKVPVRTKTPGITESIKATAATPCTLDCGVGGICIAEEDGQRCQCPLGRGGVNCESREYLSLPQPDTDVKVIFKKLLNLQFVGFFISILFYEPRYDCSGFFYFATEFFVKFSFFFLSSLTSFSCLSFYSLFIL